MNPQLPCARAEASPGNRRNTTGRPSELGESWTPARSSGPGNGVIRRQPDSIKTDPIHPRRTLMTGARCGWRSHGRRASRPVSIWNRFRWKHPSAFHACVRACRAGSSNSCIPMQRLNTYALGLPYGTRSQAWRGGRVSESEIERQAAWRPAAAGRRTNGRTDGRTDGVK